jgi:pimeloyl-ACP methyl ester carboxylesterase
MRIAFASFLLLHGIAHLVGFLTPWHLTPASRESASPATTALLGGRVTVSDATARWLGVVWLLGALAFGVVAVGVWRHASWAIPAVIVVAAASLALSVTWWPVARIGAVINAAVLASVIAGTTIRYRGELRVERARVLAGSQIIETGCDKIEYSELGKGRPVLVLHGTGGGWDQGVNAALELVPYGYRIIAPSRYGYLRTALPYDASPEAEADSWACLIGALGLRRVPVMSFSAGAAPAAQLALRHPDKVSKLVFFVPAAGGLYPQPGGNAPSSFMTSVVLRSDFPMWATSKISRSTMIKLMAVPESLVATLPAPDVAALDETIRTLQPVSMRWRGIRNDAHSQSGVYPMYPIERITAPTLFISTEDDLYQTLRVARRAASIVPGAQLLAFETGGHLMLGRGAAIWPAVAAFLDDSVRTAPSADAKPQPTSR